MKEISVKEVEEIKKYARQQLTELTAERIDLLNEDIPEKESVRKLFQIADQLTVIVDNCFDIDHFLVPEIAGLTSAIITGITNGTVAEEVEKFLAIKDSIVINRKELH